MCDGVLLTYSLQLYCYLVKRISARQRRNSQDRITINVVSSASHVPTKTFGTNERLAEVRAENMKYDLVAHFEKKYAGKVNVVVLSTLVDGPAYEDDSADKEKYWPFQFVSLKTE